MAKKVKGVLVTQDEIRDVEFLGLDDMYNIIGCTTIEAVGWLFDNEPTCYVDDEGKFDGARPNRAVYMGDELVDIIFGNMLFCGIDLSVGKDVDITPEERQKVLDRFGEGREGPGSGFRAAMEMVRSGR